MMAEVVKSAFMALFLLVPLAAGAAGDIRFAEAPVRIEMPDGNAHEFAVEWAVSPDQRERGLMYREDLDADAGMIFDFGAVRTVLMWMKNTPLPLDMLFINDKGIVIRIEERAEPFSENIISSGGPVRYVLEINGGRSRELGIVPGARIVAEPPAALLK